MGFLKALLIILLVYFLLRIIGRWLAPRVFRYAMKKTEDRFREAFDQARTNGETGFTRSEGEIGTQGRKQGSKSSNQIGEYIDFEEIE